MASSFTSLATTAKPLPASPAEAASIVAFNARRLVWSAISLMVSITLPMSTEASFNLDMDSLVESEDWFALLEILDALVQFFATSLKEEVICSIAAATDDTEEETLPDASAIFPRHSVSFSVSVATAVDLSFIDSAPILISEAVLFKSSEVEVKSSALWKTLTTILLRLPSKVLNQPFISSNSSVMASFMTEHSQQLFIFFFKIEGHLTLMAFEPTVSQQLASLSYSGQSLLPHFFMVEQAILFMGSLLERFLSP
ncbi:MAG: hypothetical protein ACD_79C01186G0004 [uncultured bacterium]|nr:MAG: hypothetical protein ACD_79C01186G0004 [uncultured bacterium]